jgi:hypothetical protein
MRCCFCLAALAWALIPGNGASAANIISPGPPAVPADYLEINLSWLPSAPGYSQARAIDLATDELPIFDNHFWAPRVVGSPNQIGKLELSYGPMQFNITTLILLNFKPEIDAGLAGIAATIGEVSGPPNNMTRPVNVTGAGGYSRTYTAQLIPEPAGAILLTVGLLALVACVALRRRRARA